MSIHYKPCNLHFVLIDFEVYFGVLKFKRLLELSLNPM